MSESYIECLVKAKGSALFAVLRAVLYILSGICVVSMLIGTGILGIIGGVIFGAAGYYLGMQADVEYEYLYMDKELTVDKILAQTKRKRVAVYSMDRTEIVAPFISHRLDDYKNRQVKVKDYSIGTEEKPDKRYAFFYEGGEKIIFSPSEEMIKVMKNANPRKVYTD